MRNRNSRRRKVGWGPSEWSTDRRAWRAPPCRTPAHSGEALGLAPGAAGSDALQWRDRGPSWPPASLQWTCAARVWSAAASPLRAHSLLSRSPASGTPGVAAGCRLCSLDTTGAQRCTPALRPVSKPCVFAWCGSHELWQRCNHPGAEGRQGGSNSCSQGAAREPRMLQPALAPEQQHSSRCGQGLVGARPATPCSTWLPAPRAALQPAGRAPAHGLRCAPHPRLTSRNSTRFLTLVHL